MSARGRSLLTAAEVSLAAITCAASFGLIRLFADASFVPQVVAAALVAHALAAFCRRRGAGVVVTALIAAVGLVVVAPWLVLGHTTAFGIPTGETLAVARSDLADAWALFGEVKAPAPTMPGFVLASIVGVWGLAFLADTAAFRAGGLVEAMVPGSTLFIFGAALGAARYRLPSTTVFLAALLAFWLSARAHRQLSAPSWMERNEGRGTRAILRTGASLGAVGVLAAILLGPNLPGADAQAVIPWRASDRDSGGSRVTVSPLVDIRARIVDQAATEVFQVESTARSYWRLTALETFDGRIWSSSRRYRKAEGTLDSAVSEASLTTETVEQEFVITKLDSIWLPAAFRPVGIEGTGARYDAESASLLTESESAIGARYRVTSALPRLDAAALNAAPETVPDPITATYLALPPSFPPAVVDLARSVVEGATTPYERARRLQDFFRGGEFVYDLNIPRGHAGDDLARFLFETKRGYCEQYAGAYAAMARAVGLPSRVGVGFTTGDLRPDGTYSVRGYHGHAWPEVHVAGFGWVPFEPTPGRGIPGGEAYTGLPEAQASPGDPSTATTIATTTTAPTAGGGSTESTFPDLDLDGGTVDATGTGGEESPWLRRLAIAAFALALAPLVWITGVLAFVQVRRWRRRTRAASVPDRVEVAWEELGEALARAGVPPRTSETPNEFAARAARSTEVDRRLLDGLAGLTTVTRYAPPGTIEVDEAVVTSALDAARGVERTLAKGLDRRTRLKTLVDPRVPVA